MTTRPMFRIAMIFLSVPALAGLIGEIHAQSLTAVESAGQASDRPAMRQTTQSAMGASPVTLSALWKAGAAPEGIVEGGRVLHMTTPSYPAAAKLASVSGVVTVQARIGADGRVIQTSVLRGPYSLRLAAQDTVRTWRYEPTLLNGKPVERVAEVDLTFVLGR